MATTKKLSVAEQKKAVKRILATEKTDRTRTIVGVSSQPWPCSGSWGS